MPDRLITRTEDLVSFCQTVKDSPFVTIDTEFLRERTYYPQLCLIQIGAPKTNCHSEMQIGIDPLSEDLNLQPLEALFFNTNIIKVFHAARQDLEILCHIYDGQVPRPLFDTQIAAAVSGYGDQVGYQSLVKQICDVNLDKSNQYTDWSRRPLTSDQVDYALGDVTYLRKIYAHLCHILDTKQRWDWVREDMTALEEPDAHRTDPETVWQKIKIRADKPKVLAVLKALAAWRELEAQMRDKPRHFILRDELLAELAKQQPKSEKDLEKIRGVPEKYRTGKYAKKLLSMIAEALESPKSEWPKALYKTPLPQHLQPALEMLKMLLRIQAAQHETVPRMIASSQDMEDLLLGHTDNLSILKGWRYEVFGRVAENLLAGKIALALKDNEIMLRSC